MNFVEHNKYFIGVQLVYLIWLNLSQFQAILVFDSFNSSSKFKIQVNQNL